MFGHYLPLSAGRPKTYPAEPAPTSGRTARKRAPPRRAVRDRGLDRGRRLRRRPGRGVRRDSGNWLSDKVRFDGKNEDQFGRGAARRAAPGRRRAAPPAARAGAPRRRSAPAASRSGSALPSTRGARDPARRSRAGVVVEAYEQLVAEGYLTSRPGGTTRVAEARRRLDARRPRPTSSPMAPGSAVDFGSAAPTCRNSRAAAGCGRCGGS